ncbi:hypothetical protein F2P81_002680 [Scophthalmus maximus]|uniref:Multidrug resistance-associated protein 4-like n=1 Tax=Scophthalmus maximus TaxID=52904 RepID=A0A6A4TTY3_SCOMX|nr:hypothetical protein F2P81_002680 [Scophthalmus maximus]
MRLFKKSYLSFQNFLLLKEVDRNTSGIPLDEKNPNCIEMKKLTCYWDKSLDAPSLQNVSVNVKSHKLLTVIGPVGAGKSSLLSAILRELPLDTGTLQVKGQLTYASQQPWLFPGTIRSNILFGRELNSTKCICGLLKNKTRVLVTHQLQHLRTNDHILILKEGHVMAQGSHRELLSSGLDMESLMRSGEEQERCARSGDSDKVSLRSQRTNNSYGSHGPNSSLLPPESSCTNQLPVESVCNMVEETREEGDVSGSIYLQYFTGGRNPLALLAIVVLSVTAEVAYILQDWWLVYWTEAKCCNSTATDIGFTNGTDTTHSDAFSLTFYLSVYSGLTAAAVVFGYARSLVIFHGLVRSAQTLHDSMFSAVLRAPVAFFDVNPIGRILNRFSKDISQMDSMLPITFVDFYQFFLLITGVVAVAAAVIPHILIPIVPLFLVFLYLRRFYLSTSRDIKRLESTKAWFLFLMTSRWFALCLDSLCSVFITFTTFACIFLRDGLGAGQVGLVLTYAVTLLGNFQWTVRQSAEVENMMTSVERVVEYTQLKSEASWETQKRPPPDWPSRGMVMFKRVNFSYGSDGPQVLKDISITFQPNEKVGVVGRTGAGKSSLVSALFRLGEPEGEIYIDGVLTSEIGLHDLRQKMSIIPQVQLRPVVEELPGRLETVLAESGSNFSVGQRQLVCLARAILRKNRVLIIDEATANVDPRTDKLIQRTIRDKFRECTVLTIAHRLNTVIDSDRILVLDSGTIQELDRPFTLLQNKDGALYKMVQQMGPTEAAALLEAARQLYKKGRSLNGSVINFSSSPNCSNSEDLVM